MLKFQQLVPNPHYNPESPFEIDNQEMMWSYREADRPLQVGDIVQFCCNGRGRGGHFTVTAKVVKVNRKTFDAIELSQSYSPGLRWRVNFNIESNIYIQLDPT